MDTKSASIIHDDNETGKKLLIDYTQSGKLVSRPFTWTRSVKKHELSKKTNLPGDESTSNAIGESYRNNLERPKELLSFSSETSSKSLNSSDLSNSNKETNGILEHDTIEFYLKIPSKESRSQRVEFPEILRYRQNSSLRRKKTKSVIQTVLEQLA
jgi:hypothetical protein